MTLRSLIERFSRNRSFARRLPQAFGGTLLFVSPDSQLKYVRRGVAAFDPVLLEVAKRFISGSDHVWDIGANVGVFTFAAASLARGGSVLAVEPDAFLVNLMLRSRLLPGNDTLHVKVLSAAVSDAADLATLRIASRGRAANALSVSQGSNEMGGVRYEVEVPTVSLDQLLTRFSIPTFVKIDIEGCEHLALRGAARLLKEIRPRFLIEVSAEHEPEVTRRLLDSNYALFDAEAFDGPRIERCAFNTVAIPHERLPTSP